MRRGPVSVADDAAGSESVADDATGSESVAAFWRVLRTLGGKNIGKCRDTCKLPWHNVT